MIVFPRKQNQEIVIGDNIIVRVVEIRHDKVRLGIEAPRIVSVHREEVWKAIQSPRRAAELSPVPAVGLPPASEHLTPPATLISQAPALNAGTQPTVSGAAVSAAHPPARAGGAVRTVARRLSAWTLKPVSNVLMRVLSVAGRLLAFLFPWIASVAERTLRAYETRRETMHRAAEIRRKRHATQSTTVAMTTERFGEMVAALARVSSDLREALERLTRVHEQQTALVETLRTHVHAATALLARLEQISTPPPEAASRAQPPASKKRRKS